jgi:hypothetical protein
MKVVLSRKGFDSDYGGKPSPIFQDGTMVSVPIPVRKPCAFDPTIGQIEFQGFNLGQLMVTLGASRSDGSGGRVKLTLASRVHRDPDIYPEFSGQPSGWKAAFGQTGAAQSHLANQHVDVGDLFLFFGLFRRLEQDDSNACRYKPDASNVHVIFGWLQVGEVIKLNGTRGQVDECARQRLTDRMPYLAQHPHVAPGSERYTNNVLYIADDKLNIPDEDCAGLPGAGAFRHFDHSLQLTSPDDGKLTRWRLPTWFFPVGSEHALTYHRAPQRWNKRDDFTFLDAAGRGQEFVLDTAYYPDAKSWVANLIRQESRCRQSDFRKLDR